MNTTPKSWHEYSPEFRARMVAAVQRTRPHVDFPDRMDYERGSRWRCDITCANKAVSAAKAPIPEDAAETVLTALAIEGVLEAANCDAYYKEKCRMDAQNTSEEE